MKAECHLLTETMLAEWLTGKHCVAEDSDIQRDDVDDLSWPTGGDVNQIRVNRY